MLEQTKRSLELLLSGNWHRNSTKLHIQYILLLRRLASQDKLYKLENFGWLVDVATDRRVTFDLPECNEHKVRSLFFQKKTKETKPKTLNPKGRTSPFRRLTCAQKLLNVDLNSKKGKQTSHVQSTIQTKTHHYSQYFNMQSVVHLRRRVWLIGLISSIKTKMLVVVKVQNFPLTTSRTWHTEKIKLLRCEAAMTAKPLLK